MTERPILMSAPMVPNTSWDFTAPDLAYLLGVVHGDGHISKRSVSISVSYKEPDYAGILIALLEAQGLRPKLYRPRSALRIDVHSSLLAENLRRTKARGLWTIPPETSIADYLAGVIDTDGHLTKAPKKAIAITLKRSGNLHRLASRLSLTGLRMPQVHDRETNFKGKPYQVEDLRWTAFDQLEWIAQNVRLRHPRKARRLQALAMEIAAARQHVPLWRLAAEWLAQEPRDVTEIMERWSLTKAQADSVLGNIRLNTDVEVIPPPRLLTKYRVRKLP